MVFPQTESISCMTRGRRRLATKWALPGSNWGRRAALAERQRKEGAGGLLYWAAATRPAAAGLARKKGKGGWTMGETGPAGWRVGRLAHWSSSRKRERKEFPFLFWTPFFKLFSQGSLIQFEFGFKTIQYRNKYATACMHNNIATSYDEFYFNKKISFPLFSRAQKFIINSIYLHFKRRKPRFGRWWSKDMHALPLFNSQFPKLHLPLIGYSFALSTR